MNSLLIILTGIIGLLYFTELESDSAVYSFIAPTSLVSFLIAFTLWLVFKAGFSGNASRSGSFGVDGGDSGW